MDGIVISCQGFVAVGEAQAGGVPSESTSCLQITTSVQGIAQFGVEQEGHRQVVGSHAIVSWRTGLWADNVLDCSAAMTDFHSTHN